MKLSRGILVLLALLHMATPARADVPKRPVPAYDGRAPERSTSEALLWVPRVVLFPAYLVSEYLLRRPLGASVSAVDKSKVLDSELPGKNAFVPTFLVDVEQRSQVGLVYVRKDFPAKADALRIHGAFGGFDWQRIIASEKVALDPKSSVSLRVEGWRRSDGVFYGIGPRSSAADQSFYGTRVGRGSVVFAGSVGALAIGAHVRAEAAAFDADPCCGPTLAQRTAEGRLAHPPGFDGGVGVVAEGLSLGLASRHAEDGTGARVELHAEHAFDVADLPPDRWVRYGATAAGAVELTGDRRVLRLRLDAELADPLGGTVPFTELVALGGDGPMRGFLGGRVRDRSAAVATLEYSWPIWALLDGAAHFALGNGFGTRFDALDPDLLRISFGGGIRLHHARDVGVELMVGSGTETFADGAALDGVRFVLGITPTF